MASSDRIVSEILVVDVAEVYVRYILMDERGLNSSTESGPWYVLVS
jgi:hypothetical protein